MACLQDLPEELLEKVLVLLNDPVSVRRARLVCRRWGDLLHQLLLRGRVKCEPKVNLALTLTIL